MISSCCKAESLVVDSRDTASGRRRRRSCTRCGRRFSTYESEARYLEPEVLYVLSQETAAAARVFLAEHSKLEASLKRLAIAEKVPA